MQSPQAEDDSSRKGPPLPVWLWERGPPVARVWGLRDPEESQLTPWPTASDPVSSRPCVRR